MLYTIAALATAVAVLVGLIDFFSKSSDRKFTICTVDTEYGIRYEVLQSRTGLLWFKVAEDRHWFELLCYSSSDDARKRIKQIQNP